MVIASWRDLAGTWEKWSILTYTVTVLNLISGLLQM